MSRERDRFDEIGKKIKRENEAQMQPDGERRRDYIQVGTLNTITPCAACKLLRRRCAQECPFSPYFSPHEPQKFASVHKIFGASNVSKMLMEVPDNQRADAANSLVYEANVRLRDPVYGCMGAISGLQHQIQVLQLQINAVRAEIIKFKYRQDHSNDHHNITTMNNTMINPASFSIFPSTSRTAITIASLPQEPPILPPPPPPPPLPSPSDLGHGPHSSSVSSSSMHTQLASSLGIISSISNENISYFG